MMRWIALVAALMMLFASQASVRREREQWWENGEHVILDDPEYFIFDPDEW